MTKHSQSDIISTLTANPVESYRESGLLSNFRCVCYRKRKWRNWQTRTFEGRVVYTVRVQVPFSAPRKFETVNTMRFRTFIFFLTEKPCKTESSGNRGFKWSLLLPELFCFSGKFIYYYDFQMNPLTRKSMIVWGKV